MKIVIAASALLVAQTMANDGSSPKTNGVDTKPVLNNSGVNRHPYPAELRDYIVEKHNWARGHLVPSEASNMRKLAWDESLAISASDLVETCRFEHFTENYAYGQNLIMQSGQLNKESIDEWMVEWVTKEISESDKRGQGMMDLDHASAVLWANTYLVGCATKLCNGNYLTACNYFTPGNWAGEKTYEPGRSCSQCPSQAPFCDASGKLCTSDPSDPSDPNGDQQPMPEPKPQPDPAPYRPVPVPAPEQEPSPAPSPDAYDEADAEAPEADGQEYGNDAEVEEEMVPKDTVESPCLESKSMAPTDVPSESPMTPCPSKDESASNSTMAPVVTPAPTIPSTHHDLC